MEGKCEAGRRGKKGWSGERKVWGATWWHIADLRSIICPRRVSYRALFVQRRAYGQRFQRLLSRNAVGACRGLASAPPNYPSHLCLVGSSPHLKLRSRLRETSARSASRPQSLVSRHLEAHALCCGVSLDTAVLSDRHTDMSDPSNLLRTSPDHS